ncbi:MAG: MFS transporter, partial [Pyrinomonadaceae bacterium]
ALAGIALKTLGTAGCFFINAISYVAIVGAMMRIDLSASENTTRSIKDSIKDSGTREQTIWQDLKEGFRYVLNRPRVRAMLLITMVVSIFGAPYLSLMPIFARDIFKLDEGGLALLTGVMGAGALMGALFLAMISSFRRKILIVLGGGWLFGLFMLGFSLSSHYQFALLFLFGMGFMMTASFASINTLIQYLVENRMRGRVTSIYIFSLIGTMPIGNLLGGISAEHFGAPMTLAAGGIIIVIIITYISFTNKKLREME